jgi:glycosyltransferase involved in cell wall biosynthesis
MNVFYFITKTEEGGAQSVIAELLKGHQKRGDNVSLMASGNGWLADQVRELGFLYYENSFMRKTYNPMILFKAGRLFREAIHLAQPDVVSIHSSFSGMVGRIALMNRIPVVYTAHGWGFTTGTSVLRKLIAIIGESFAAHFCTAIICVSQYDLSLAQRYHIAPDKKLHLVRNGTSLPQNISLKKDPKKIIVFCARFARPKRQDVLLQAFAMLPAELRSESRVVLIGYGPHEAALKELAQKLNINPEFTGQLSREAALARLGAADVAVLISDWEGFPMVNIEAMQLGVPVISNAVGGIPEALTNQVGILLPTSPSVPALTEALKKILTDDELRSRLSLAAKEHGKLFSAEHMVTLTMKVLTEAKEIYDHRT